MEDSPDISPAPIGGNPGDDEEMRQAPDERSDLIEARASAVLHEALLARAIQASSMREHGFGSSEAVQLPLRGGPRVARLIGRR